MTTGIRPLHRADVGGITSVAMPTSRPPSVVRLTTMVAAVLAVAIAPACGSESKPGATSPTAGAATDKPADSGKTVAKTGDAPNAGGDKVKKIEGAPPGGDDRYQLMFDTPEATAGQESSVTVRVVPKEPWHMNLDFPTSLKVTAPEGVTVANADLKKGDAKIDEKACAFDIKFTAPKQGEQTFSGKFKFAVCQDAECAPVTEQVEFKVAVK